MRKYDDLYNAKLAYLRGELGGGYTTVPEVAQKILHVDEGKLRNDPSFPVVFFGTRRRVPMDRLASWLVNLDIKGERP